MSNRESILKKNVVLGAAINYDFGKVLNFIISLKNTTFDGDIIILVSHREKELAKKLEELGVLVYFHEGTSLYRSQLSQSRYFRFFEILQRHGSNYDRVLLSDTRDVVFQEDPFIFKSPYDISFYLESPTQTIGSCKYNSSWVKVCFGRRTLWEFSNYPISCCGTTIGTMEGIVNYLQNMLEVAETIKPEAFRKFGSEQAIHNYMLYKDLLPNAGAIENGVHVNTMHYVSKDDFIISDDGIILNKDGTLVPVMHQYDRIKEIKNAIDLRYSVIYKNGISR